MTTDIPATWRMTSAGPVNAVRSREEQRAAETAPTGPSLRATIEAEEQAERDADEAAAAARRAYRPLAKVGDVFTCQTGDAIGVRFMVDSIAGDRARMKVVHEPVSLFEVGERSLWNHSEWCKEPWSVAPTPAAPAPDLRAIVRDRMTALGLTQAALARRMAPRWGCADDSAVKRLSRWHNSRVGGGDMTSDALAELLAELGGSVTWSP